MRIRIKGVVQGVGLRPAVYRTAVSLGLRGRVWNDGPDVIIDAEDCASFPDELRRRIPPLASVTSFEIEDRELDPGIEGFGIIPSERGGGGVGIPTDTAVCARCLEDMREGRRAGYEFTSCTDCGARFTILSGTPYDRGNTSMSAFPMCRSCREEYEDPGNRRFHHQTVCCPECGPSYRLLDRDGGIIPGDPAAVFAEMLGEGKVGIVKSWGGMHICAVPGVTGDLRDRYGRPNKPFALMVRDARSVLRYAEPTEEEMEHLVSAHRPIVLVRKVRSTLNDMISPGLDSIGLFLPYTGMQHRIFGHTDSDALIMTSANLPGEPMIVDDEDVMGMDADMYLLHDQRIINRADDSVLRVNLGRTAFIRKSRGHVPEPIVFEGNVCSVAVGAQENLTASVSADGRIHTTQHIGDGGSPGVQEYLEDAAASLIDMAGRTPDIVAMDLHPGYSNRPFARRLAREAGCELMEVQHHWAHGASLLADAGEEECTVLSMDGTGYGSDGNAWGGEILDCSLDSFRRTGHLEYIPLLGSERALHDLRRLKFAVDEMNGTDTGLFGERDSEVLRRMMGRSVGTSSMGRLLDILAFTLGVCERRTYDGEPAMRMEPLLAQGRYMEGFETWSEGGVVRTADLFSRITGREDRRDVAYSIVYNVVNEMVDVACDAASGGMLGLTGGVSYNGPICRMVEEAAGRRGFSVLCHRRVPNGDGGISVGQAAIAARRVL